MPRWLKRARLWNFIILAVPGIACGCLAVTITFTVAPRAESARHFQALSVLGLAVVAVWVSYMAISQNAPRAIGWALRLAMLGLVVFALRYRSELTGVEWLCGAGLFFASLFGHHICRALILGWVWDDNGERQKVSGYSSGRPRYKPTTRRKRIEEEVDCRNLRDKIMRTTWPILVVAWAGVFICSSFHSLPMERVFLWINLAGFCVFAPTFALEVLYKSGWQLMKGHKVRDEAVPSATSARGVGLASSPWSNLGVTE